MRVRAKILIAVQVAIVLALLPVSAHSVQKITPGGACKTYKQKVVYSGKTYTCSKSGKKLIWSKGVAVFKPVPTPTATPEVSATSTPTPVTTPTPTPVTTPTPAAVLHPNKTKPVTHVLLATPGFKSYEVSYEFQLGDEHVDLLIFESLTGEFKGEQRIVYNGNAKSVSINTPDYAPRWVLIRTRDQWSDSNISEVKAGPVTPKNADIDTSTAPAPPTGVQVFCRLSDASSWVLCSN